MQISVRTAEGAEFHLRARPGQTWAQAVYLSGFFQPPGLCSGLGNCGHCRLRLLSGPAHFSPHKREFAILGLDSLAQGWRLGCLHEVVAGLYLELPPGVCLLPGALPGERPRPRNIIGSSAELSLALDFGTTSLNWLWLDREDPAAPGKTPAPPEQPERGGRMINPQAGAGSDIVSRLALAANLAGRRSLQSLSLKGLGAILREAAFNRVREVVLAANPAMTYLLLGRESSGLAAAPYRLDYRGGETARLPLLPGLPGGSAPPLWVCPLISPFIGGDISAGYAWLRHGRRARYPFMLADLGTNGEFVLALNDKEALAASVPLGPALEGMGLQCGALAGPGVITGFELTATGLDPLYACGRADLPAGSRECDGPPDCGPPACAGMGISGSGYLDLLRQLLRLGLMDASGRLGCSAEESGAASPLLRRLGGSFGLSPCGEEKAWYVDDKLYLSAGDVGEILKVKAAFSLALQLLLQSAGLAAGDLKKIYVAGALGNHSRREAFVDLGFVPQTLAGRLEAAGNTALRGAALLIERRKLRDRLVRWCAGVETLNLAENKDFQKLFAREMFFGPVRP